MIKIANFYQSSEVAVTVFKGGEVNVKLSAEQINEVESSEELTVIGHLTDSNQVMAFFLTIDAIRRVDPEIRICASIPYMPYARQDRVCNPGEALSVALFAKLLNAMDLKNVYITDPHSDVTAAVINNSVIVSQDEVIARMRTEGLTINLDTWLVAPDAGALKKTHTLVVSKYLKGAVAGYITASKHRDIVTNEITETFVYGEVAGKDLIVVDDICDGGRTFIELGKVLREKGCRSLQLVVTHGIFSYGVEKLLEYFDSIYTTDSFHPDPNSEFRKECMDKVDSTGAKRIIFAEC